MSAPVPAPVAAAPAAAKIAETLAAKVQKHVDGLQAKIQKLSEENSGLKAALHEARSSNSRIRRIPKKPSAAAAEPAQ